MLITLLQGSLQSGRGIKLLYLVTAFADAQVVTLSHLKPTILAGAPATIAIGGMTMSGGTKLLGSI